MFKLAQITKDYREAPALCSQINLFGFVDEEIFLTKSGDLGIVLGHQWRRLRMPRHQYNRKP